MMMQLHVLIKIFLNYIVDQFPRNLEIPPLLFSQYVNKHALCHPHTLARKVTLL